MTKLLKSLLLLTFVFNILSSPIYSSDTKTTKTKPEKKARQPRQAKEYIKPAHVDEKVWEAVKPYFLPTNHPTRGVLDQIFSTKGVLASKQSLKSCGFKTMRHPQNSMIIAKHKKLNGYLLKIHVNSSINSHDWVEWKHRIKGANLVRESIKKNQFSDVLKVPKKWIYPLREGIVTGEKPKNFVLVVTDMKLCSWDKNLSNYKHKITERHLQGLYTTIKENLLIDSIYPDNIPFSKDGRIAFIDTEHYNDRSKRIRYTRINRLLSSSMEKYWMSLISK